MKKVAVLLATHNGEPWLDEQIQSLLQQEDVLIDVFSSDDDSSDKSLEILCNYSRKCANFHLIEFPKPVSSAARNFTRLLNSIDLDEYDFIAFSDQDDVWHLDKLSRAIKALEENNCDGYSASVQILSNGKAAGILGQSTKLCEFDFLFEGAGQGCTYVITRRLARSFIKIINSNPEWGKGPFYHDWCIYTLSRILAYQWFFDPRPALLYRQHGSNDIGAKSTLNGIRSRIARIKSGWYSERILHVYRFSQFADMDAVNLKEFSLKVSNSKKSIAGRLSFLALLALKSRRKFSDRLITTISEVFGCISHAFANTDISPNSSAN